jgi:hypothetical protein
MKTHKIIQWCLCLLLAGTYPFSSAAQSRKQFKDRTENWLQNSRTDSSSAGALRGSRTEDESATETPAIPVGNSLFIILLYAGIYSTILRKKGKTFK